MKIFVAYKFSGTNKEDLKNFLERIGDILKNGGHETYIHFRDAEKWKEKNLSSGEIIADALDNLGKCDSLLALMLNSEKSEGMLIEAGFAKATGKKIILAIKEGERAVLLRDIADMVIEFRNLDDLDKKIRGVTL